MDDVNIMRCLTFRRAAFAAAGAFRLISSNGEDSATDLLLKLSITIIPCF
jgi:hypothetical protein